MGMYHNFTVTYSGEYMGNNRVNVGVSPVTVQAPSPGTLCSNTHIEEDTCTTGQVQLYTLWPVRSLIRETASFGLTAIYC